MEDYSMDYQIAFSPDLEIGAEEFAEAWNSTSECRSVAEAQVDEAAASTFDPTLDPVTAAFLLGVASSISANGLSALVKVAINKLAKKKDVQKNIHVANLDNDFGKPVIVVTITDEK